MGYKKEKLRARFREFREKEYKKVLNYIKESIDPAIPEQREVLEIFEIIMKDTM